MFSLTQSNIAATTLATTGLALTPFVSAVNVRRTMTAGERENHFPLLEESSAHIASSGWIDWALSGYFGDFLSWTGEKLAQLGGEITSPPTLTERRLMMRGRKQELEALFAEALIGNDVKREINATLNAYLRQGLILMREEAIHTAVWQNELSSFAKRAERMGEIEVASVLKEWQEKLNELLVATATIASNASITTKFTKRTESSLICQPKVEMSGFAQSRDVRYGVKNDGLRGY